MSTGRRIALEMMALYAVAIALNLLVAPRNPGFVGVVPHPYLLVVLLVAGRYGFSSGTAAAVTGGLLYVGLGALRGPVPHPLQNPHAMIMATYLVAAGIVGPLFDGMRRELQAAKAAAKTAQVETRGLSAKNEMLEAAIRELRGRIMGETETIESLYEMAQKLTTLHGEALPPAALELMASQTGATACRYFGLADGILHFVARYGPDDGHEEPPRRAVPAEGLLARAIGERRLVTVREVGMGGAEDLEQADEPIVVAPLASSEGAVTGLITIDRLPFTHFTPHTMRVIGVITDWTARAAANVSLFTSAEERVLQEERAFGQLVERLRQQRLSHRDLDYLETLAGAMRPQLLEALHSACDELVIRTNALLVLERIQDQLGPEEVASLKKFTETSLREVLSIQLNLADLEQRPEKAQLEAMCFVLRRQVRLMAAHLVTAWTITIHREQGVDLEHLRSRLHPLLGEDEARRETALEDLERWVRSETMRRFAFVVRHDAAGLREYNREVLGLAVVTVEDYLVGLLTRRNHWAVCMSLYSMGRLGWRSFEPSVIPLVTAPNRYVRETAMVAIARICGTEPPQVVREAIGRAASEDEETSVRRVAREIVGQWEAVPA